VGGCLNIEVAIVKKIAVHCRLKLQRQTPMSLQVSIREAMTAQCSPFRRIRKLSVRGRRGSGCGKPVLITDKVNIWREILESRAGLVCTDTESGVHDICLFASCNYRKKRF
jgi:hypothetical protein